MAFDALTVAHDLIRALRRPVALIARHDADLASQLRRAGTSIPGNLAEGRARLGRDARYHYSVAAGSAREVDSHLRTAVGWGYVEDADVAEALALLDRAHALCWRLSGR